MNRPTGRTPDVDLRNLKKSYRYAGQGDFSAALASLPAPPLGKGNSNWAEYRLTLKLATKSPVDAHDLLALFLPRLTNVGKEHVREVAETINILLDEWRAERGNLVVEELAEQVPDYEWRDWDLAHLSGKYGKPGRAVVRTLCFGANEELRELADSIIRNAENIVRESMGIPHVRERKNRPRKAAKPPVAMSGFVSKETLPYPYVHYTDPYGTFLSFSESKDSVPALCSCAKPAVENLVEIMQRFPPLHRGRESPFEAVFRGHYFPEAVVRSVKEGKRNGAASLCFEDKLCHRCNLTSPKLRYCSEMYGGIFVQHHGWYVNQLFLRWGVLPGGNGELQFPHLDFVCPSDIVQLIEVARIDRTRYTEELERLNSMVRGPERMDIPSDEATYWQNVRLEEAEPMKRMRREAAQSNRAVTKRFENMARAEFGFRKVGEQWVSETLLLSIVRRIFENTQVLHHHRPEWLDGLELDIFVPALKIGFEYQGQQHFHPVKLWGGKEGLKATQKRDQQKRELCTKAGVQLVEIDYTEPLTEEHVRKRVRKGSD